MPRVLDVMLRQLWPESCPRCGLEGADGFCGSCYPDFARVVAPCRRCAMPRPCNPCRGSEAGWNVDRVNAPFVYAQPLAQFLRALKYHRRRELGRALGQLLAAEIAPGNPDIDFIVSVPLHPRRLRSRTFNQAHEIARCLAAGFRVPLAPGVLRKVDTRPQTELDQVQRRNFAGNAFSVRGNFRGARVAVVDDVITTGATISALAGTLKAAGAIHVQAWAVARSIGRAATGPQSVSST